MKYHDSKKWYRRHWRVSHSFGNCKQTYTTLPEKAGVSCDQMGKSC